MEQLPLWNCPSKRKVGAGHKYFGQFAVEAFLESPPTKANAKEEEAHLTNREKDVLKLIPEEHTNQEVADLLFISLYTVETHRKNLMSKLNVKKSAGITRPAIRMGIVDAA